MNSPLSAKDLSLDQIVHALRIATHDSPDPAFMLARDGVLLMANSSLCASMGVDERALIGQKFAMAAWSVDPERVLHSFRAARAGAPSRFRASGCRPDGQPFIAEVTQLPVRVNDAVVAIFGTAVDLAVGELRDARARQSEDLLRLAGRIARFGGWALEAETRKVSMSDGARSMLSIPDDADLNELAWHLHPEDEQRRISSLIDECLAEGTSFDLESIMLTTSGAQLTVRTVGEAQRLPDGRIVGVHGALWDVTEAVAAREREHALEGKLSVALAAVTDSIYFLDDQNLVTYANPRALELLRHSAEELRATPLWILFPEAVQEGYRDAFDRARLTGEQVTHRAYSELRDGWFETTAYPTDTGLAVYLRDVTDEARAHETAQQAREQLAQQAALLDTARDAMIVRELDGRIRYWNRAAELLYGWSADEAVGRQCADLVWTEPGAHEAADAEVMGAGYFAGELTQRTRDGRTIIVDCRWQLLADGNGAPQAIFAVNTDISDYHREQDARQRAQRMESLGTLASGIAHDLNNVLTPLLMSVQLLRSDETDPERSELLASMESSVKRGADMIGQVLSFARGVEGQRVAVDIDHLIDDLVSFSRTVIPPSISVVVERHEQLGLTVGDPTQLLQVLMNLVTNARDAMSEGGQLRISVGRLDIIDKYTSMSHSAAPGRYLTIAVEDDGHGIVTGLVSRVFEPFFTTKIVGMGTGLGLSTSLAIVRGHGGFMQVYSEPQRGTRFVVGLPVSTAVIEGSAPSVTKPASLPAGDGELVLVIDDDESIRRVTSRTLEAHGYRTATACNGQEGIDLIERGLKQVDLVLTDMIMPVMDGAATSAYLEEHHPSIPIIGASGLVSGANASRPVGMGITRFIAKPYTTSVLLTTVRDTLLEHRASFKEGR